MADAPEVVESDIQALERFVVDNDDLLQLEEMIGRFNIFDALGIARAEIRHSNFLAWLLDPAESHGQGDLFLKAFLMDLLRQAPVELRPISLAELEGVELCGVEIRREWERIDILLVIREPEFVVAIENKVDSGEHSDQLVRYERIAHREFQCRILFVLLSPDGRAATSDRWISYQYSDLHRALVNLPKSSRLPVKQDVATFVDHYLNLIESRMMDNPRITELCRKIYTKHRRALDLVWENQRSPQTELLMALEARLQADPKWIVTRRRKTRLNIAPLEWRQLVPPICAESGNEPWEWLVLEIGTFQDTSLYVEIYIGPTHDITIRNDLIARIEADPALGVRNRRKEGIRSNAWRVLYSKQCSKWGDAGPDIDTCVKQAMAILDEFAPYLARLTELLRFPIAPSQ